jgi:hypothetical protein
LCRILATSKTAFSGLKIGSFWAHTPTANQVIASFEEVPVEPLRKHSVGNTKIKVIMDNREDGRGYCIM